MFLQGARTASFVTAGLTGISGAATTYSTGAVSIQFCINSKFATAKAQVSGGATPTTGAISAAAITLTASKARAIVWCLDIDGAVTVHEGPIVSLDGIAGSDAYQDGRLPAFPAINYKTYCPIAYHLMKAKTTLSGTFTFGTNNWNTTGMDHTIVNVPGILPDRPQSA